MSEEKEKLNWEKVLLKARENWLALGLGVMGLILILVGGISLGRQGEGEIIFESATDSAASQEKIKVDIEGAVVKPGVYELTLGSRIKDLLILAGGLAQEADRDWVGKNLNLAAKLADGGKVYIPERGETLGISGGTVGEKINLNAASAQELESLPGVGPVTAQKIISNRPYQLPEDLLTKKVVGQATFEKIKEQISVW